MPDKQRTFGQFDTPPTVADLLLALCMRRATDRVLDPSCGAGAFLRRAAAWRAWLSGAGQVSGERLWGVELDEAAAQAAQEALPAARILHQNFFAQQPQEAPFDVIVGNPPYTRAEWIARLQEQSGEQLSIFEQESEDENEGKSAIIPAGLWKKGLSRRAGLYAYFFLHGVHFLREGGRFGFVLPNNWLDVAYGEGLKQFLLEQFKIIALIESTIERWFEDARVNTCLLVLEKCGDGRARNSHLVRFIQLRQRLEALVRYPPQHRARFSQVEALTTRLLPGEDRTTEAVRVRVVRQDSLRAREKWGIVWRAPSVYRRVRRQSTARNLAPLKQWAQVQRGYTTGANEFFYLDQETIDEWEIEARFRRPLLKSLRTVDRLAVDGSACAHEVLAIPPGSDLAGTGAAAYLAWGESQDFHRRQTCRARRPWYALPQQEPAPLILPKGIWGQHLAPHLKEALQVDQQLYQIRLRPGVPLQAAAALLNSAWLALQLELQGRVNFGEGVLWLAGYEVEALLLPDPRYLDTEQSERLANHFRTLAARPVAPTLAEELTRPDRRALNDTVFNLLELTETEAVVLVDTLLERVDARQTQAQSR